MSDWIDDHAVDLSDPSHLAAIDIVHGGDVNSTARRQEVLERLVVKADAIFILGGGKASKAAAEVANPARLLVLSQYSIEGAFTAKERDYYQSDKLRAEWMELASSTDGKCVAMAHGAARRLGRLLRAAQAQGPALPWRSRSFQLSIAIVAAAWVFVGVLNWNVAQAKSAYWLHFSILELLATVALALLLRAELSFISKRYRRRPFVLFWSVLGAALLSSMPILGFVDAMITRLPPAGTSVADPGGAQGSKANKRSGQADGRASGAADRPR